MKYYIKIESYVKLFYSVKTIKIEYYEKYIILNFYAKNINYKNLNEHKITIDIQNCFNFNVYDQNIDVI